MPNKKSEVFPSARVGDGVAGGVIIQGEETVLVGQSPCAGNTKKISHMVKNILAGRNIVFAAAFFCMAMPSRELLAETCKENKFYILLPIADSPPLDNNEIKTIERGNNLWLKENIAKAIKGDMDAACNLAEYYYHASSGSDRYWMEYVAYKGDLYARYYLAFSFNVESKYREAAFWAKKFLYLFTPQRTCVSQGRRSAMLTGGNG